MEEQEVYQSKNKIRLVTAGSLFDGHDVAINIMRRILQKSGAEVIHLGHNRSVEEVVNAAIQEDVQGIALTSYQGGHLEYFKYTFDLLHQNNAKHIKIFGGGGGTILPSEIQELEAYGITKIYSPDDGRAMGLQGMINHLLQKCDFQVGKNAHLELNEVLKISETQKIASLISAVENFPEESKIWVDRLKIKVQESTVPILGITGTGGAGKSSIVDELILRFSRIFPEKSIGIISVDPSKRKTGGALLGDRIRMNAINSPNIFMRSVATRQYNLSLSKHIDAIIAIFKKAGFDLIILETSGIGQSGSEIIDYADFSVYIMTPEFGAASQLEKIDMLDFADLVVINKFDKRGSLDALRDVKKQYQRNHDLWNEEVDKMPVIGTIASQFNDPGINELFEKLISKLFKNEKINFNPNSHTHSTTIIPGSRIRYLSEIAETIRQYDKEINQQSEYASRYYALQKTKNVLENSSIDFVPIGQLIETTKKQLKKEYLDIIHDWEEQKKAYSADKFVYKVRNKNIEVANYSFSLSKNKIPKISVPKFKDWGDILKWKSQENFPGSFPFTAGVFPFKRDGEDPTRMFAGEGGPERTNKRFHYLSLDSDAKRLSTAFDSVTLYGEDPAIRPDIYGKIGNSGVNICTLDDAKKLYSGFDLCNSNTSVSMTINGPAATICAYYMNAAIDQQCEKYIHENGLEYKVEATLKAKYDDENLPRPNYNGSLPNGNNGLGLLLLGISGDEVLEKDIYNNIKSNTLKLVRGTVQADILKEDQAQNTCIFSTEFSLKLMGDVQEYFISNKIKNFYSVSISGYHIAEAGANPITQLAFTLANGFTFVEYYLSRGMQIDDFAQNLSFFFSNGIDPEYAVIGRVARKIWAKAMKFKYGANERSQKLKYHIQTSGRSLHAQEIAFNDIRTTLQALYAIFDNCNSLHTNAYDEAITTPTEESVRRAVAIQMIINKELGLAKNENPLQGSFIIEELTELVENAVLLEFDRLTERGGVLGAMETMYQRGKIQEESMHYEMLKHSGAYPIIGVNTFLSKEGSKTVIPNEVIRANKEEKVSQIRNLQNSMNSNKNKSQFLLDDLKSKVLQNKNIFESLMETTKYCSLGQITNLLYEVGGRYRRNM